MIKNPYIRNYPGLYRGIVESNIDPEGLGRCKVRVPSVHGELTYPVDILPWARPLVLSPVKSNRGSVNIPDTGDIVWILFEGSNKDFPIYLGGTYATGDVEINNDRVDFYIENDARISYYRTNESYEINVGESRIIVSKEGIHIEGDVTIDGEIKGSISRASIILEDNINELNIPIEVHETRKLEVYHNGLLLIPEEHYSATTSTVSLNYDPEVGDTFDFVYIK